ncbi:MAG: bifunctional pyr operon transcriptional regulator/uracil phosphoribosyltransferase PyrR [Proteobacteria bacterium]|nr:bifunctional pyr operon transcriptional regulator/uracil phosphoribosyltransferase PyrR [Pseudomonadota bacterium]MBU1232200.1 bifunctional pyr operon transcriptional regulator/uracil phosphoribosyltransferase PyrR [Pseudomonadota bacterium]MBU1417113.1 bifunctional pyr operon transcriptional regulator/uracil phosphoribosyltransferase PyrR [Pseudomonadota bacterium]MBU1453809.1 bifunctional pyr operon transcriptional regulator/uracil phosphoribosyltransferase PyrR [Pseudomonadota bacterium]
MESRTLLSANDLSLAVNRISLQILERNHNIENLAIVGIHTCGVFLAQRIRQLIQDQTDKLLPYGSLDINLYRDDWSLITQNPVVKTTDIGFTVEGQDVILVDDVLFTGRTIRAAMDALMDYGRPHSIQLAVLVDRGGRELPIQADYVGVRTTVMPDERIKVILEEHGKRDEVVLENKK